MFSDKIISYIYGSIKHVDVPSIELKRKEKYKNKKIEKKEKVNYIPNIEVKKLKRKEKVDFIYERRSRTVESLFLAFSARSGVPRPPAEMKILEVGGLLSVHKSFALA